MLCCQFGRMFRPDTPVLSLHHQSYTIIVVFQVGMTNEYVGDIPLLAHKLTHTFPSNKHQQRT